MGKSEFDEFAGSYRQLHKSNISISGEEPEYFADYKMEDFYRRLIELRAPLNGKYLDFGCGIGASILPLRRRIPDAKLFCADVSLDSLKQAEKTYGKAVTYLQLTQSSIPMENHALDGAFACCVFHHIEPSQHSDILQELRRVLRPRAPLMIYEHNPLNPLTVRTVNQCEFDRNAVLIRGSAMARLCRQLGYSSVNLRYRVFFPAAFKPLRRLERHLTWLPLGAQYAVHAVA